MKQRVQMSHRDIRDRALDRSRKAWLLRHQENYTFKRIGEFLGVSRSRAHMIVAHFEWARSSPAYKAMCARRGWDVL